MKGDGLGMRVIRAIDSVQPNDEEKGVTGTAVGGGFVGVTTDTALPGRLQNGDARVHASG